MMIKDHNHQDNDFYDDDDDDNDTEMMIWALFLERWLSLTQDEAKFRSPNCCFHVSSHVSTFHDVLQMESLLTG